jgi:sigma-B regulation protein RsbU (phosphoserine phosphatase)
MREVGGDFYDLYMLPDGRLAALIADVSGKGVPAALFMALTVSVFRFAMSLNMYPGELLGQINQLTIENQQSRMFATVFIGYINFSSGEMQFACAGHNPPMLYRANTGAVERLSAKGVAMGLFSGVFYEEKRIILAPGDALVLYTDGIDEMINKNEEDFGEARLQAIIEANAGLPAEKLSQLIIKSVADFVGGQGIFDDQTLVVVKRLEP